MGRVPPRLLAAALALSLLYLSHAFSSHCSFPTEAQTGSQSCLFMAETATKTTPKDRDVIPSRLAGGTPLQMLVDEQKEFDLNRGKAMDTLRNNYPKILTDIPDFSIYHKNIEVVDPSGVTLHGLKNYKTSFQFLHAVINFFYCPERSILTFRLIYDCARNNIRVSWNAEVVPKAIFGGIKTTLHVDGISVYELDRQTGLITKHRVEHLLINDAPVTPPRGIFDALRKEVIEPNGIPVLNSDGGHLRFEFKEKCMLGESRSSLFSSSSAAGADVPPTSLSFDQHAFERKNAYRKKFGLAPITPDEFEQIQEEVKELDRKQKQKAQAAASAAELARQQERKKENFLSKMFGNILEDTCDSNYDCNRPQVCCDFGFKKMCCASGQRVINGVMQKAVVPVTAGTDYPRGGPDDF